MFAYNPQFIIIFSSLFPFCEIGHFRLSMQVIFLQICNDRFEALRVLLSCGFIYFLGFVTLSRYELSHISV